MRLCRPLHGTVVQLFRIPSRCQDVFARGGVSRRRKCTRRGVRARRHANRSHFVVGVNVRPVVDSVLELQLRQTQLPVDSLGTDIAVGRGRGGRLRNDRAGTRDLLLGVHTVLVVPGDRTHVVRSRQFFHEKDHTVVDSDRGPYAIHVLGRTDDRQRCRQRLGQVGARGSVVLLHHELYGRPGRFVLRQGIRHDSYVLVGFPTPVQCQL